MNKIVSSDGSEKRSHTVKSFPVSVSCGFHLCHAPLVDWRQVLSLTYTTVPKALDVATDAVFVISLKPMFFN